MLLTTPLFSVCLSYSSRSPYPLALRLYRNYLTILGIPVCLASWKEILSQEKIASLVEVRTVLGE